MSKSLCQMIEEKGVAFVDLRWTNASGQSQHLTLPEAAFKAHYQEAKQTVRVEAMQLELELDASMGFIDPFFDALTLVIRCQLPKHQSAECPRAMAKRATQYLKQTPWAGDLWVGASAYFYLFDDVRWKCEPQESFFVLDAGQAHWNTGEKIAGGNAGHRPTIQHGFGVLPPLDTTHDLRSAICVALASVGIEVSAHAFHGLQGQVTTSPKPLLMKADEIQTFKHIVHQVAHNHGKTATFMPQPLLGQKGNDMYCQLDIVSEGKSVLSEVQKQYFIGGILQHMRALQAITNPTVNSYKRLATLNPQPQSSPFLFPDASANPYLAFSALLLAGIDGIESQLAPSPSSYCRNFDEALDSLALDQRFLLAGDVFSSKWIAAYVEQKRREIAELTQQIHPMEFGLYYSV